MSGPDSASASHDAMQTELRRQLVGVAWPSLVALAVVLILSTEAYRWPWRLHLLALILVSLCALTWALLRRWYLPAAWSLVLGCVALSLVAAHWWPPSAALCLLVLPTALATLLIGLVAGVAVAIVSTLAVLTTAASVPSTTSLVPFPALVAIWGTTTLVSATLYFTRQTN